MGRAIDNSATTSPAPVPILIGRAREHGSLCEELSTVIGGRGRLVLLGGEAGIGKTALAQRLAGEAAAQEIRVLSGHCYDLTNTPPYGPWLDLFNSDLLDLGLPSPPAAFAGGKITSVTDQASLFADVRRFFTEFSADRPALVLLEDLHWADPASLELLRHIAHHVRRWPILLLVTYRVDELTRLHPFARQLPALVREAAGMRLDLRRLDLDALRALVATRYNLPPEDSVRLLTYLEQHAEGNPFFTTELLRALEEDALLRQVDGRSELGALDHVVVPPFLRQVIEGRVAHLGEDVRQTLAVAAVIGQEVPLDLWAAVADLGGESLLTIVEQAIEAHLLEAERDGTRVRFVHALTREALYEGILPPRRRLWHGRVAEMLMANAAVDPDAVAYHLQQAGDARAAEWLVKAADRAQRAYAWVTAAERLRTAAALLEGVEGKEQERCRLACRIGWLERFSDPARAIPAIDDALRAALRIGDAFSVSELRWVRGALLMYSDRFRAAVVEMSEAIRHFDAIDVAASEPSGTPAPIQSWFADALPATDLAGTIAGDLDVERLREGGQRFRRSVLLWYSVSGGQRVTALETDEQFAALADVPGTPGNMRAAVAFTCHGLGIAYAALGQPDKAHRMWTWAGDLFAAFDHHALNAFALLNELRDVALTYDAALPARRRQLAAEAEAALARAGGALPPGVSPQLAQLNCLTLDGNWDDAVRILSGLPMPGNAYLRREVTDARAALARHRGEPEVAWAQIRALFPRGPATEPGDLVHQEGLFLQRLAADLCLDAHDIPSARAWLEAHEAWLAWSESVLGRADGQLAWARYHWATGNATHASATANAALALAATPNQPLVRLAGHRLLGEIGTSAGDYAAAEEHLAAALDLASACDAPFERALTLLPLAELHVAMGHVDEATAILEDLRRVCIPLQAAPLLARARPLAARLSAALPGDQFPDGLTRREMEVLRLLPRGLSNAEIAEILFLSPRTVQTHLTNLYGKLAVGGRAAAVAYAIARGLA